MRTLYHCINQTPRGDFIRASYLMERNGREDRYVFAATHLSKSLAFAFSYHDGEVIMNGGIDHTENEYVLICGGQKTLDRNRHIHVYAFPDEGFIELVGARQAVSLTPVPFSKTELLFETSDIDVLMENGLQIFLLPEDMQRYTEGHARHVMAAYMDSCATDADALAMIRKSFKARWINAERNIGVCSVLQVGMQNNKAGAYTPSI